MSGVAGRSGRKPKRERFAALYKATERELHAILPEVPQAVRELVIGVLCIERSKDGERAYYRPPNIEAIKVLLNRTLGPEIKRIEVTGEIEHRLEKVYVEAPRPRLLG